MPSRRPPFFASARGRLLIFNLLVVAVTLMVSGVAVLGFRHASQIQEQVQQQTLNDMTGNVEDPLHADAADDLGRREPTGDAQPGA